MNRNTIADEIDERTENPARVFFWLTLGLVSSVVIMERYGDQNTNTETPEMPDTPVINWDELTDPVTGLLEYVGQILKDFGNRFTQ